MRIPRNFFVRDANERGFICENSWCNSCGEADIGLIDPVEYEEAGQILVEGACVRCGGRIFNTINEERSGD